MTARRYQSRARTLLRRHRPEHLAQAVLESPEAVALVVARLRRLGWRVEQGFTITERRECGWLRDAAQDTQHRRPCGLALGPW